MNKQDKKNVLKYGAGLIVLIGIVMITLVPNAKESLLGSVVNIGQSRSAATLSAVKVDLKKNLSLVSLDRKKQNPKFGYNGWFLESVVRGGSVDADLDLIKEVIADTGATWVRFPGGTRANKYVFNLAIGGLGEGSSFDKMFSKNLIEYYADYIIQMGNTTKTTFVINMAAHYPEYYGGASRLPGIMKGKTDDQIIDINIGAIKYLLDRGVNVAHIEIGNEGYLHNISKNRNAQVNKKTLAQVEVIMKPELDKYEQLTLKYIEKLDQLAKEKKTSFKYGVPISTIRANANRTYLGSYAARNEYWNIRMAKLPVDALIPHIYTSTDDCKSILLRTDAARTKCLVDSSNEFLKEIPGIIDRTRTLANGKEIWITEFNAGLGHDSDNDARAKTSFVNSQDHIRIIQEMVKIFEEKKVENYLFHMLSSNTSGYAVVNKVNNAASSVMRTTGSGMGVTNSICALIVNTESSARCQ